MYSLHFSYLFIILLIALLVFFGCFDKETSPFVGQISHDQKRSFWSRHWDTRVPNSEHVGESSASGCALGGASEPLSKPRAKIPKIH